MRYQLAKQICQTLFDNDYTAYIAGGYVRDLLLGQTSDEIDIATSAPPYIIQELFEKTVPVGIAFGVVIVVLDGIQFELTTFRKDHPYLDGRHPDGVDFSTPQKDAQRRDFTINGMFYDPLSDQLLDYVEGRVDLENKIIRAIGEPKERFYEDRLRMMRAIRFAARLNFAIHPLTWQAIVDSAHLLLPSVSMERIWQELSKMASVPHFDSAICLLHESGLLATIFPQLKHIPMTEIENRCRPFPNFPPSCPAIAYLLELFPSMDLGERLNLCLYLKTTVKDRKLAQFFYHSQLLVDSGSSTKQEWAHFYAHPLAELFIHISAAKSADNSSFLQHHHERQKQLLIHIERIKNKHPLVTAEFLKQRGVAPGKEMGLLLKEAECIAIEKNCHTPEEVLHFLI